MRVADVLGTMAFRELNAHLLQPISDVRAFEIGAGDTEAQIDEHLRDARHTDAADADEMDVLNSSKHVLSS